MYNKREKVLVLGAAGSGGSYLCEFLLKKGFQVYGTSRWGSSKNKDNLSKIIDRITLLECDLTDLGATIRTIKLVEPALIYNLAAHANVHVCFNTPISVLENNIKSSLNLFEALRILGHDSIVLHASTSEVYGLVREENLPINEKCPLNPVNPYSVSKLTQEMLASCYWNSFGIKTITTRSFSYINPRRDDLFASSFAKQIVEIENYERKFLEYGNLDSIRTLMDVRDMSEAYFQASFKCKFGEVYNVGGRCILSVGQFLEKLKEKAKVKIKTKQNPKLLRPIDVTLQICDSSKFEKETGWVTKFSLDESIDFLLEHYRAKYVGF